ncbi:hypothetical protein FDP22_20710 (plasmid) [Paroceanicella profunda]|uniref:Uncharacterized protein n=1 Tax=Paroceanicella profunda TaxID=2579971 RepID=A0A5B8G482_9RHOB|nr:hypothetical protein FDP22_20710 [Paroceanicella profunda]
MGLEPAGGGDGGGLRRPGAGGGSRHQLGGGPAGEAGERRLRATASLRGHHRPAAGGELAQRALRCHA